MRTFGIVVLSALALAFLVIPGVAWGLAAYRRKDPGWTHPAAVGATVGRTAEVRGDFRPAMVVLDRSTFTPQPQIDPDDSTLPGAAKAFAQGKVATGVVLVAAGAGREALDGARSIWDSVSSIWATGEDQLEIDRRQWDRLARKVGTERARQYAGPRP